MQVDDIGNIAQGVTDAVSRLLCALQSERAALEAGRAAVQSERAALEAVSAALVTDRQALEANVARYREKVRSLREAQREFAVQRIQLRHDQNLHEQRVANGRAALQRAREAFQRERLDYVRRLESDRRSRVRGRSRSPLPPNHRLTTTVELSGAPSNGAIPQLSNRRPNDDDEASHAIDASDHANPRAPPTPTPPTPSDEDENYEVPATPQGTQYQDSLLSDDPRLTSSPAYDQC